MSTSPRNVNFIPSISVEASKDLVDDQFAPKLLLDNRVENEIDQVSMARLAKEGPETSSHSLMML